MCAYLFHVLFTDFIGVSFIQINNHIHNQFLKRPDIDHTI
jgi:hypothetical protein